MSPRCKAMSVAERYDQGLCHARNDRLPPDAPRPLPTRYWPRENVELLERYRAWLLDGGASEQCTDLIYLPFAGHVLGFNLKPHPEIDLDWDLECVRKYAQAKRSGKDWLRNCRNSLVKFQRFLRLERGLGEVQKVHPFDVSQHTQGLPAWLVSELERFQRLQQRNWRVARMDASIRHFWATHLNIWRFLCEQQQVVQMADLKRAHILAYVDFRLNAGRSVSSVNTDLRTLHGFLAFLQGEGYPIPQVLLRIPCLKAPDPLPKYLTDEQVRLLRDNFEGRVAGARLPHEYRDALLGRAIFYLLWQCGLRVSEVEELRLEDLDLGGRKISIRDGKGRKDRTVYATDTVIRALQEYLALRGSGSGDHVFLFRNAPLSHCFIHSRIKTAGQRVGVKVYPHRLRHTAATQLLNAGCRITSIQRFLGHKKLNTTMIYARVLDQTVAEDYFKAMVQVEKQLTMPEGLLAQPVPVGEMLKMVDLLVGSILEPAQSEIIQTLRSGLSFLAERDAFVMNIKELADV
jgi:site-specific recombinase XerD